MLRGESEGQATFLDGSACHSQVRGDLHGIAYSNHLISLCTVWRLRYLLYFFSSILPEVFLRFCSGDMLHSASSSWCIAGAH